MKIHPHDPESDRRVENPPWAFAGTTFLPKKGHSGNSSPCVDCAHRVPGFGSFPNDSNVGKRDNQVLRGLQKWFSKEFQSLQIELELGEAFPKSQAWERGGFGSSAPSSFALQPNKGGGRKEGLQWKKRSMKISRIFFLPFWNAISWHQALVLLPARPTWNRIRFPPS